MLHYGISPLQQLFHCQGYTSIISASSSPQLMPRYSRFEPTTIRSWSALHSARLLCFPMAYRILAYGKNKVYRWELLFWQILLTVETALKVQKYFDPWPLHLCPFLQWDIVWRLLGVTALSIHRMCAISYCTCDAIDHMSCLMGIVIGHF